MGRRKAKKLLKRTISRREFLKKGLLGLAGLGIGAYALGRLFKGSGHAIEEPPALWKWSKEAYHYVPQGREVHCGLCPRRCILDPGERGVCRDRINIRGRLYSLVYGNPCAVNLDPIEKKPFFHFLPGSSAFSIATAGCNLRCMYCQNWEISQFSPEETNNADMMPELVVANAKISGAASIAYTYSEPTAFYEYMYDTSVLAKEQSLRNVVVSAGYINREPLKQLCSVVDAIKIDLKGFNKDFYRKVCGGELDPVLESIKTIADSGVWLELVNLIVPTLNDDPDEIRELCRWVRDNLGPDVPLHFSRFHPDYKLKQLPPTPPESLLAARRTAFEEGLHYVYVGNLPGTDAESTYCPNDNVLCVERSGYEIIKNNLVDGKCPICGNRIPGVWL